MVGALDADGRMTDRLTLRYRTPVADHDQLLAAAGRRVTGHEFHRTVVEPAYGERAGLAGRRRRRIRLRRPHTLHASYLHLHWAGHPHLAQRFADAVHALRRPDADRPRTTTGTPTSPRGWSTWR